MFQLVVHQWYQWCHWFSQQSEKKLKMIVTLGSSKSEQQSIWTTVRVEILKSQSHAVNITTCSGPTFVENATFLFRFHSQYIRFQCVISVHFWVWAYISRYAVGKTLKQIRKNKPFKIVFFSTFFFILLDGIVFSLVHVFEMYPVFLRVISGWYSLFMFHFWLKKINYCLCVGRKFQVWLLSGHAEQLVSVLFAIPFHNAIFVWLL